MTEGRAVGDYHLEQVIGRGGMGIVYRARSRSSGLVVALKLMIPELAGDDEFRERFEREGQFVPSLDHPNVVTVYDFGEADGELYIAMQLIEGANLKELVKEHGRLDPARAVHVVRQVASALDAAHELGVVHRDVKPQNVLISPGNDGENDLVYISDFGLIRPVVSQSSVSRTGQVFGSVPYTAPEVIENLPADGRADVYSLGCVLYESLTGQVPFDRDTEIAVVWAHIHDDPPKASAQVPSLGGGVDDVILQAMAKHPDDRYLTCGEMADDLDRSLGKRVSRLAYAHMRPLVERIPRKKTEREIWAPNFFPELSRVRKVTNRVNWFKVAAFVGILGLIASMQFAREGGIPQVVSDVARGVGNAGNAVFDALAMDSKKFDQARSRGQRPVGAVGPILGDPRAGIGTTAGSRQKGALDRPTQEDVAGVAAPSASAALRASKIVWSDWACTNTHCWGAIHSMNADGTELTRLSPDRETVNQDYPDIDPWGRIAFNEGTWAGGWTDSEYTRLHVFTMDADGRNRRQVTDEVGECASYPQWSPDGKRIAFSTDCWDTGEPSDVWIVDAGGGNLTNLTDTESAWESAPLWSPDGTQLVYTAFANATAASDIWVMDADGTDNKLLIGGPGRESGGVLSPDGRKIAFSRAPAGNSLSQIDAWIANANGSGQRQLTDVHGFDLPFSWSPDGKMILFRTGRPCGGCAENWVMNIDGSGQRDLVAFPGPDSDDHWESGARWQQGHHKRISLSIESGTATGEVVAPFYPQCGRAQRVNIQAKTSSGWRKVATSTSTSSGGFSVTVPDAGRRYRAVSPFQGTAEGALCGPAISSVR
ncbi:MAG TPA: protein kinase [Actinomycetota bacterium]|nr:protein kinase [Actinomycetota bacterium]